MIGFAIHKSLANPNGKLAFLSCFRCYMGSKFLLKPTSSTASTPFPSPNKQQYHNLKRLLPVRCSSKPTYKINPSLPTKTNGFSFSPLAAPVGSDPEVLKSKLEILRLKLAELGIELDHFAPGKYTGLLCPMCRGGDSKGKSFSLFISVDGEKAYWNCFRAKCGWRGRTEPFASARSTHGTSIKLPKVKQKREITEQSLELEPLCNELVDYFKERLISVETLVRNNVKQKSFGDYGQVAIAFTYWRNGTLVSCKYRDINKKFWQKKDTEKIFYGLDDIKGAEEIIIVEGEMDKLAMEEAGFLNCVSVPDGAPPSVSSKELPSQPEDTKYQYLWNCKEYLDKASRIILATDGDAPGQALAEEIARRVGRERCWRVSWPKKNTNEYFKDANEVLMYAGPLALRDVIENAELYPIRGLFNFSDFFSEIDAYYHRNLGFEFGASTGLKALNEMYIGEGNAAWFCHRAKCGWKGRIKVMDSCSSYMKHETESFAGTQSSYGAPFELSEVRQIREITEQSLELEPLCHELVDYFKERLISAETLVRNHVMQRSYYHGQVAIAFTYWRNGVLVSCKYRDINKKFWQEKDTEKIFYGLDDIKGADEIIIVEGEVDKLSMEEAGFLNCVSVPDGAPASVSSKELLSQLELGHDISVSLEQQGVL